MAARTCACGARYHSADIVFPTELRNQGHVVYDIRRIKPGHASFKCCGCGMMQTQRLRQPGFAEFLEKNRVKNAKRQAKRQATRKAKKDA